MSVIKPYVFEVGRALCPQFRMICEEMQHFHGMDFSWREGKGFLTRRFYVYATEELIDRISDIANRVTP